MAALFHNKNGKSVRSLAFAALFFPAAAHCNITINIYCFDSRVTGLQSFELYTLYEDTTKWSGAFVKYRNANSTITLVNKDATSEEIAQDMPYQVITRWYEVHNGNISGEYEMISQGAMVYSMTYINNKTQRQEAFHFNPGALKENGDGCVWE